MKILNPETYILYDKKKLSLASVNPFYRLPMSPVDKKIFKKNFNMYDKTSRRLHLHECLIIQKNLLPHRGSKPSNNPRSLFVDRLERILELTEGRRLIECIDSPFLLLLKSEKLYGKAIIYIIILDLDKLLPIHHFINFFIKHHQSSYLRNTTNIKYEFNCNSYRILEYKEPFSIISMP